MRQWRSSRCLGWSRNPAPRLRRTLYAVRNLIAHHSLGATSARSRSRSAGTRSNCKPPGAVRPPRHCTSAPGALAALALAAHSLRCRPRRGSSGRCPGCNQENRRRTLANASGKRCGAYNTGHAVRLDLAPSLTFVPCQCRYARAPLRHQQPAVRRPLTSADTHPRLTSPPSTTERSRGLAEAQISQVNLVFVRPTTVLMPPGKMCRTCARCFGSAFRGTSDLPSDRCRHTAPYCNLDFAPTPTGEYGVPHSLHCV